MFVQNEFNATEKPFDLATVPWLREVDRLRCSDFWDGPISGVAIYDGHILWFHVYFADDLHGWEHVPSSSAEQLRRLLVERGVPTERIRIYLLYRLSTDQLREEQYWDDLFVKHVTAHHGAGSGRSNGGEAALFYEPYQREKPTLDLSRAPVVAAWVSAT